ncbi:hypothetical protein MK280_16245 [Myxococcota bacterium]|nr:hypothetical protein [Myxococcota bacterium]
MVSLGVIDFEAACQAIDGQTLRLILGMMIQSESGYADWPFLLRMAPVGLTGLAVLIDISRWIDCDPFDRIAKDPIPEKRRLCPSHPKSILVS